jgi:hypothetical protein
MYDHCESVDNISTARKQETQADVSFRILNISLSYFSHYIQSKANAMDTFLKSFQIGENMLVAHEFFMRYNVIYALTNHSNGERKTRKVHSPFFL